jgi:hypothetical protein
VSKRHDNKLYWWAGDNILQRERERERVRERVKLTSKYRGYEDVLLGKAFAQFMEQ